MTKEKKEEVSKTIIGWAMEENIELTDDIVVLAKKAEAEKKEALDEEEKKKKNSMGYVIRQGLKDNMAKIITAITIITAGAIIKYYDLPVLELL